MTKNGVEEEYKSRCQQRSACGDDIDEAVCASKGGNREQCKTCIGSEDGKIAKCDRGKT